MIELVRWFTERSMARRTWNGSVFIVDQDVSVDSFPSNPHGNNGLSKILGTLLSDFVSRGSECPLWRHQSPENEQVSTMSVQSRCRIGKVCQSAGISEKCSDIGIDFSGITAWSQQKLRVFLLKFHRSLFLRAQLTIRQHWFRYWLGADQATNHYLNQCWPSSLTHICGTRGRWFKRSEILGMSQCRIQSILALVFAY